MSVKGVVKGLILLGIFLFSINLNAQTYLGVTTSNYNALHAARFNPASLNTSSMKWQVNLIGADFSISQNYLKAKSLIKWGDGKDNLVENLNGEEKTGYGSVILALPGFMFTHKKAGSFGLNFTARGYMTLNGVNENFISAMYNNADTPGSWPTPWKDDDLEGSMNVIGEASLSYARNVFTKGRHNLYAGITLKFLTKQVGANINGSAEFVYDRNGSQDMVSFGSTNLNLQVSKMFDDIAGDNYSYKTGFGGFGADIGFIYELKPQRAGQALVGDNMEKSKSWKKERPDYIVRAGFAIIDIGNTKFSQSEGFSRNFISNGNFVTADTITEIDQTYENWDDVMNTVGSFTVPTSDIKVKLPLAINMFADAKITDFFYINFSTQIGLGKNKIESGVVTEGSGFALTPRFETPAVSIAIPVSYNSIKGIGIGAVARFGQVTLGMSDITGFFTGDASNTTIHFGLSFGVVKKKKGEKEDAEEDDDDRYL